MIRATLKMDSSRCCVGGGGGGGGAYFLVLSLTMCFLKERRTFLAFTGYVEHKCRR